MKRREFLKMAVGAFVAAPVIKQTFDKAELKRQTEYLMMELAKLYVGGTDEDRKEIIENLDRITPKYDNAKTGNFVRDYRDTLLPYNVIPATI